MKRLLIIIALCCPLILAAQSSLPPCPAGNPANWHMCQGTHTLVDGSKYVGEFKDSMPNGQGTYTYPSGSKYVGEFKNGKFKGQGTYTHFQGSQFIGTFEDGVLNGWGTAIYDNGMKYIGVFQNAMQNGQGTLIDPKGNRYVGGFKDNKPNGAGILYLSNGTVKGSGQWTEGNLTNSFSLDTRLYPFDSPQITSTMTSNPVELTASNSMPTNSTNRVKLIAQGGTFKVPVRLNDQFNLNFTVDSGASDVSVPADVVLTLMRTGTISNSDFRGEQTYVLADGSKVKSRTFIFRELKVGNQTVRNVAASIADVNGSLLLGQSFLKKFKFWAIDNSTHELVLQ